MPKILANSINMHYQTRGSGPDVVLIHGVTSSMAMWYNGIVPSLEPEFRATFYDLRGHGLTDLTPTGYTTFDLSEDLRCLLDALGIEKAMFVGHSFGGAIATHFAARFPERARGVVMLDSGFACLRYLRIIKEWGGWNRATSERKPVLTLDQFMELDSKQDITDFLKMSLNAPRVSGFRKGQSGFTPRQRRLVEETSIGSEFREIAGLTEDLLKSIRTPMLALYGETSPYRKMAAHLSVILPDCSHDVILNAGHFYSVWTPGLVADRIAPFLRDPEEYVRASKLARPVEEMGGFLLKNRVSRRIRQEIVRLVLMIRYVRRLFGVHYQN
jgi:pimeloyl-ACP methyl ester carboxylesterase